MIFAELIEKYIVEMADLGKPISASGLYGYRRLQRDPIAQIKVVPFQMKPSDIVAHCKLRRKKVAAATVMQDISLMRGPLVYAAMGWDMPEVTAAPITSAMKMLQKYELVGKSTPRDRRPTDEEIERLLAYFDERAARSNKVKIPMRTLVEFSIYSARRIGETCRLRWGDVNGADMTCIVRDMKDPKKKKGNNHEFPLLGRAWDIVMAQPRKNPENPDERIFPYNSHSVSACYTAAKKVLGIKGLRLHDCRREAASRAFEGRLNGRKYGVPEVMVITGHKNPQMLIRTYTRLKAADLHVKPDAAPPGAPASTSSVPGQAVAAPEQSSPT